MTTVHVHEVQTFIPLKDLLHQVAGLSDFEELPENHQKRNLINSILSKLCVYRPVHQPPLEAVAMRGPKLSLKTPLTAIFTIDNRQATRPGSLLEEGQTVTIDKYYKEWKNVSLFHTGQYLLEDEQGKFYPTELCFIIIKHGFPVTLGPPGASGGW